MLYLSCIFFSFDSLTLRKLYGYHHCSSDPQQVISSGRNIELNGGYDYTTFIWGEGGYESQCPLWIEHTHTHLSLIHI